MGGWVGGWLGGWVHLRISLCVDMCARVPCRLEEEEEFLLPCCLEEEEEEKFVFNDTTILPCISSLRPAALFARTRWSACSSGVRGATFFFLNNDIIIIPTVFGAQATYYIIIACMTPASQKHSVKLWEGEWQRGRERE